MLEPSLCKLLQLFHILQLLHFEEARHRYGESPSLELRGPKFDSQDTTEPTDGAFVVSLERLAGG